MRIAVNLIKISNDLSKLLVIKIKINKVKIFRYNINDIVMKITEDFCNIPPNGKYNKTIICDDILKKFIYFISNKKNEEESRILFKFCDNDEKLKVIYTGVYYNGMNHEYYILNNYLANTNVINFDNDFDISDE